MACLSPERELAQLCLVSDAVATSLADLSTQWASLDGRRKGVIASSQSIESKLLQEINSGWELQEQYIVLLHQAGLSLFCLSSEILKSVPPFFSVSFIHFGKSV